MELDPRLKCAECVEPIEEACHAIRALTALELSLANRGNHGRSPVAHMADSISKSVVTLGALGCGHDADELIRQISHGDS